MNSKNLIKFSYIKIIPYIYDINQNKMKTIDIRESVSALIRVEDHSSIVDEYDKSKYDEKFPFDTRDFQSGSWYTYKGFKIKSTSEIELKYE